MSKVGRPVALWASGPWRSGDGDGGFGFDLHRSGRRLGLGIFEGTAQISGGEALDEIADRRAELPQQDGQQVEADRPRDQRRDGELEQVELHRAREDRRDLVAGGLLELRNQRPIGLLGRLGGHHTYFGGIGEDGEKNRDRRCCKDAEFHAGSP